MAGLSVSTRQKLEMKLHPKHIYTDIRLSYFSKKKSIVFIGMYKVREKGKGEEV